MISQASPAHPQAPLDAIAAERWQRLAWQQFERRGLPWLHQEVGERMARRLQWIMVKPQRWLDWRAWNSGVALHQQIAELYPNSESFLAPAGKESASFAHHLIATQGLLRRVKARLQGQVKTMSAPQAEGSMQMLWANMSLHTEPDPARTVAHWHKLLAVDGFLMFSCLGSDTALELRQLYAQLGWTPAAHPLIDMHDWGDLLVDIGFAEPVVDMERIVLTFATPERALDELRGLGRNFHPARYPALRTRAWRQQLLLAMDAQLRHAQGQIQLTFEIIYGHAFKPAPRLKMSRETVITMQDMRTVLAKSRPSA